MQSAIPLCIFAFAIAIVSNPEEQYRFTVIPGTFIVSNPIKETILPILSPCSASGVAFPIITSSIFSVLKLGIEFTKIARACGYKHTASGALSSEIKAELKKETSLGSSFLEAYKRDRKEKLNYLEDKVKVLMSSFSSDNGNTKRLALFGKNPMIKSELIEDELGRFTLEEKSILEIESFLLDWIDLINDEKIIESELKNQIFSMVKKFEITKRLFQTYSFPDMKRGDNEVLNLMPYILFHTLLFKSIDKVKSKEEEMILFNCALKVGDIISSSINRITTPCEVILSRNAFEMELDYFRSIRSL